MQKKLVVIGLSALLASPTFAAGAFSPIGSGGDSQKISKSDVMKETPIVLYDGPGGVPAVGAVPEPASWAMMIAGFGFVGMAMRRRRATPARQTA